MGAVAGWPGFGYSPVRDYINRIAARQLRTARKNMIQAFERMGLLNFAQRLRALRANPRLNTMQKRNQFQRILDDYARTVAPRTETPTAPEAAYPVVSD